MCTVHIPADVQLNKHLLRDRKVVVHHPSQLDRRLIILLYNYDSTQKAKSQAHMH